MRSGPNNLRDRLRR